MAVPVAGDSARAIGILGIRLWAAGGIAKHRWKTDTATEQLIRELARMLPDQSIASVLNRLGIRSAKGHTWTQLRVRNFRCEHQM